MAAWYELKLQPDNGSWVVTSPEFEEVATFGETQEEACRWGLDAILQAIAGRMADGEDIPPPATETKAKGFFVQLPLLVVLKAGLYVTLRSKGQTRAALVRTLGVHREQVDRLFRLDHNSRIEQLGAAFKALGVDLKVKVPSFIGSKAA